MAETTALERATVSGGVLSEQQLNFFEAFGFLKLPGFLADDIASISSAFEEVFAAKEFLEWVARAQGRELVNGGPSGEIDKDPVWFETHFDLHFNMRRVTIPAITDRHERLRGLPSDPRLLAIATALMGADFEIKASDGNLFYCDTSWHADMYGSPLSQHHVKISTYLDPLDAETGAIRLIPGTHFFSSPFARKVRSTTNSPDKVREVYGIEPDEVPSYVLESEPGDVVVWDYRTVHAAFNSGQRRRLLSMNYGSTAVDPPAPAIGRPAAQRAAQQRPAQREI